MKPHLIMPMGGAGSRFYESGYTQPKPLIEINGKPFLYWASMSIIKFIDVVDVTFIVLKQHINDFKIDTVIKEYFPNARIKVLTEILPGPVFTALKGVESIDDDNPIIVNDCDHMFRCKELNDMFLKGSFDLDGVLLTFESSCSQFSYVKYNELGRIIGTIEKKIVSNHAICGAYVFRTAELLREIAAIYIRSCPYNECFMSGLYNIMCDKEMRIRDCLLDFHLEFGTPEEYEVAKKSEYFCYL